MKKIFSFLFILSVVLGGLVIFFNQPKFYANPEHAFKFFSLPSEATSQIIVLDELHSQGKNGALGMGIDNYWLKITGNLDSLGKAILKAGGTQTDSIYIISLIKGDNTSVNFYRIIKS